MQARRGGGGAGGDGGGERVRTHMMFGARKELSQRKKTRRPTNKLHQHGILHDKMVQTGTGPTDIDPTQWTGNQRILHFGPMANRDPFFYYYPKGWDILYPAQFGFFPYRTSKFRGSSPTVCLSAFGCFFVIGGLAMIYFGYFHSGDPFWTIEPIDWMHIPALQIAGPVFIAIGLLFLMVGICWWFFSLNLFRERLRHTQPHHAPPKRTVRHMHFAEEIPKENLSPYQPPPPPVYPVLVNEHTEPTYFSPEAEMKLYPPALSGYSTLSLQYIGSPYNTLGGPRASMPPSVRGESLAERRISRESKETARGDYHHASSVPASSSVVVSGKRRSSNGSRNA